MADPSRGTGLPNCRRLLIFACSAILLAACESENEHFCAKYSFYYRELTQPGLLPYDDLEEQLRAELHHPGKDPDRARIGLFVLADIVNAAKPIGEDPREYCMRRQLWNRYR